jgi:organic radical activating enzyme
VVRDIERVSIELTQRCRKACWFCYSASHPEGATELAPHEVVAFAVDLAAHGVRAVSFGGGEPLEYEGVFDVLADLRGVLFRSLTTNGLLLHDPAIRDALVRAAPDKVHVSIHFPERAVEVQRVITQVAMLEERGLKSGVNLLVSRSMLEDARVAAASLHDAGIGPERVVLLPMRGRDTPSPEQLAWVAGGRPFQSMTCLTTCAKSSRFCAVAWNKTVAWCSYTSARQPLESLTHAALVSALADLDVTFCGGTDDDADSPLVRLSRRPQHGHDVVRGRP